AASIASRITDSGTPFSLATASTTSNSSLLICSSLHAGRACRLRLVGSIACGFLLCLARARVASRLVLRRRQPEGHPVGYQARLVDVVGPDLDGRAVDVERDASAVDRGDRALKPAATVLRQLQADLGLLADETLELLRREQRAVDAGGRHLQRVIAADRVLHVQLRRH